MIIRDMRSNITYDLENVDKNMHENILILWEKTGDM